MRAKLRPQLLILEAISLAVVLRAGTTGALTPPAPPYLDEGLTLTLIAAEIDGVSVDIPDGGDGFWHDAGLASSLSYGIQAVAHLNGDTQDNSVGNYFADGGALVGSFYEPRTGVREISGEIAQ
jgi:outer membrane scaffolding protein for murein synthesis (MipA/OmpV family)